jgi:hypothetical protein
MAIQNKVNFPIIFARKNSPSFAGTQGGGGMM